jgi:hypothetical protein
MKAAGDEGRNREQQRRVAEQQGHEARDRERGDQAGADRYGQPGREQVALLEGSVAATVVDPVERPHHGPYRARHLPDGQDKAPGEPEQLLPVDHLVHGAVDHHVARVGDVGAHVRRQVGPPDAAELEEAQDAEDEEHERDDRGEDLEGDRARVREQVVALETVQHLPRQEAHVHAASLPM